MNNQTTTNKTSSTPHVLQHHDVHVPPSLILTFFEQTTKRLQEYSPFHDNPTATQHTTCTGTTNDENEEHTNNNNNHNDDDDDEQSYIPKSIQKQQQNLLNEQIRVLNQVVDEYNRKESTIETITVQNMQDELKALGEKGRGGRGIDDEEEEEVAAAAAEEEEGNKNENISNDDRMKQAMATMNDEARLAFCRSILQSEYKWYQYIARKQQVNGVQSTNPEMMIDYNNIDIQRKLFCEESEHDLVSIDRESTLKFCGLCSTAVKIPQLKEYIHKGTPLLVLKSNNNDDDSSSATAAAATTTNSSTTHMEGTKTISTSPQQRISHLQQMILCAIGFEPSYGAKQVHKQMTQVHNNNDDDETELKEAFATFLLSIETLAKEVVSKQKEQFHNKQQHQQTLSDTDQGGVTRVVSVNYSEHEIHYSKDFNSSTNSYSDRIGKEEAPKNQRMEEQSEERQRDQLQMAQRAAQLQQQIVQELMDMDDHKREECLTDARLVHEQFLNEALNLPPDQRVVFMQNVDPVVQKKLLMYKLWEGRQSHVHA